MSTSDDAARVTRARAAPRLAWVDVVKGLSILWITYFHLVLEARRTGTVDPLAAGYLGQLGASCADAAGVFGLARVACWGRGLLASLVLLGFHAVGVFLVVAGFGLARALGDSHRPQAGWVAWYRRRLLRLFPFYWVAHGIVLAAVFARPHEAIDLRLLVSLTGLRIWPIETIHHYLNPAWWYLTLLIELYLVFPALWWLARRLGPTGLVVFGVLGTAAVRAALFAGWAISNHWAEGALFAGRMAEFTFGMALGIAHRRDGLAVEARLFRWPVVVAGLLAHQVGIVSYRSTAGYCFTNALVGIGLFVVLVNLARWLEGGPLARRCFAFLGKYSYGIYLLHLPFVMYAGGRMRALPTGTFVLAASGVVALVVAGSVAVEHAVERSTDRWLEWSRERRGRSN